MSDTPDLENAYALDTPEANLRLYADWAESYDQTFATQMAYQSPAIIAERYAALGHQGPVLDLGAGTGLLGEALSHQGVTQIDGTDISPVMLAVAARKGVYARLFEGDLTAQLDVPGGHYAGAVSAGTFTHGHVGPQALHEVVRILRPGGVAVLSVNAAHWESHGFATKMTQLAPLLDHWSKDLFDLYGDAATGDHAKDKGWCLTLQRKG